MQSKRFTVGVVTMCVSVAVVFMVSWMTAPDLKEYEALIEPRIIERADERMLTVTASGDIARIGGFAKEVAAKYYRVVARDFQMPGYNPLRARFEQGKTDRVCYGLPVSPLMREFFITNEAPYSVAVSTWTNGMTAEILHKGPYKSMGKTIDRLTNFIHTEGYAPLSIREEVYVSAPAGLLQRTPTTLIRIPVKRRNTQ
ncbi:MAG: hypothetical protein AABZ39_13735 [Spirochaetota bacterium]